KPSKNRLRASSRGRQISDGLYAERNLAQACPARCEKLRSRQSHPSRTISGEHSDKGGLEMAPLVTEWVKVTDDVSIIARESGEVWFHTASGTKDKLDPFATPMTGAGASGSTILLLDGAINLGFAKIEKRMARPEPTLPGYVVALVGAYHTSVDTPRNLRRAAKRFGELGR